MRLNSIITPASFNGFCPFVLLPILTKMLPSKVLDVLLFDLLRLGFSRFVDVYIIKLSLSFLFLQQACSELNTHKHPGSDALLDAVCFSVRPEVLLG